MEFDYQDPARRGRSFILLGVILALVAGGAAFLLLSQAREQAERSQLTFETVVVAARDIPARKALEDADLAVRDVPVDPTNEHGVFADASKVVGLVTGVPVLAGQPVFANMLAGQAQGSEIALLEPGETIAPDSPYWRAVSITVPDDRAVGGLVRPGQVVDVVVTAAIALPEELVDAGRYYSDRSTKVVYQDVVVLARTATTYVLKATIQVAEELGHLQASGAAGFTLLIRPAQDLRTIDLSAMGTTTTRIIARYGLPLPEVYPSGSGPLATPSAVSSSPAPAGGGTGSPTPTPVPDQP